MRLAKTNRYGVCLSVMVLLCSLLLFGAADAAEAMIRDKADTRPTQTRALDTAYQSVTQHQLRINGKVSAYTATAGSLNVTDDKSKLIGNIFYISYTRKHKTGTRPLTFVFNGGPGAASAYLHLGALGPQRVEFADDGSVLPMPARLSDNAQSWLAFTDLVFVDPIGTGYSRELKKADATDGKREDADKSSQVAQDPHAWGVAEDADALARFIRTYLTREQRWLSPVYLAGESYGGFRVARLSRLLQADFGVAPSGLVLISPALDFSLLWGDERSLWPWVALLPSYAAAASVHQRSEAVTYDPDNPRGSLGEVEGIVLSDYLSGLAGNRTKGWPAQAGKLTGLSADTVERWRGRIPPARFAKALLAEQRRLVSLYDATITLIDPEPTAAVLTHGDPYLERLNAPITAAFNHYVRKHLAFKTDLPYQLLNEEVFESWNWRSGLQGQQGFVEALADLKQAMSTNTDMRVMIVHGVFDLVTPYYASEIAVEQMALDPAIKGNITLKVYHGGHMPYLHQHSRQALFEDAARFYRLTN